MNKIITLFLILILKSFQKSDVYFTKEISGEKIVEMFKKLNITLKGNIGLKVHTGEKDGPYYLRPSLLNNIYDYTNGTFIECNTAYLRRWRHNTSIHQQLLEWNGWNNYRIVLMDENEENDIILNVTKPHNITKNYVGEHLYDYNSCLVLAHFKGHPMGGFGGAMKQLSIGFASRAGKSYIHSGGYTTNYLEAWTHKATQKDFTAAMADAASTVVDYFKNNGGIAYINVLANISKVCDCGGTAAPPPKIRDIGILASLDPVAIDKACYDLIVRENTEGSKDWINQSETLLGLNTLNVAEDIGMGTQDYNFINIDDGDSSDGNSDGTSDGTSDNKENDKNKKNNTLLYVLLGVGGAIVITAVIIIVVVVQRKKKSEKIDMPEQAGLIRDNEV